MRTKILGLLLSITCFGKWTNFVQYLCPTHGSDHGYCEYEPNKPAFSSLKLLDPSTTTINYSNIDIDKCTFRLKNLMKGNIYFPSTLQFVNKNFNIYFNDTFIATKDGYIYQNVQTNQITIEGLEKRSFTFIKVRRTWVSNQESGSSTPTNTGEIETRFLPDDPYVLQYNCK